MAALREVIAPLIMLVCAWASVAPRNAAAQSLQCEARILQRDDERRLLTRVRSLIPADVEAFVAHPCRTADGAAASIITAHVKAGAGVLQWWELACRRKPEDWTCDSPVIKQYISTQLLIGGKPRHVELTFDKDTTLHRAQQLSARALTLFADPASRVPQCSSGAIDPHWAAVRARHRLPAVKRSLRVSVRVDGEANSVMLDDIEIEFRFPAAGDDESQGAAKCWNEWVVVTQRLATDESRREGRTRAVF